MSSSPQWSKDVAATPFADQDKAALGGTFTTDLTAGVLGTGDKCVVEGLTCLVYHEEPCSEAASPPAHLALHDMTVHREQCASAVFPNR